MGYRMLLRWLSLTLVCVLLTGVVACAKVEAQEPEKEDQLAGVIAQASAATEGTTVLGSVPTLSKSISLVFFGAPEKDATKELLALLKKYGVRATFFLPGISVAEQPDIAKEIFAAGHELGNYALSGGEDLSNLPVADAARKLYHAQNILMESSNQAAPVLFATGGTNYTPAVLATAKACGLTYALRPTAYLNYMSFSSPDQARMFASFTDYGSILAFKAGQLTEEELNAYQDEEVDRAPDDPAPSSPATSSGIELPEDESARMLLILDWLLGAYKENGYAFLQPEDLQKEAEADLGRTFVLSDAPTAAPPSVIKNAATTQKAVSLTFQSLCGDKEMESLLNTLAALDIRATFFVTGEDAATRKALIKSIALAGHDVESGGFFEKSLNTTSFEEACKSLFTSIVAIKKATGKAPAFYRPPYGNVDESLQKACQAVGLTPILYNKYPPMQKEQTAEEVLSYFSKGFHRGDIITLHMDEYRDLDEIVKGIAAIVFDTGYSFAPIAELYANQYEVKPLTEIEGWDEIKLNRDYDPNASIRTRSLSRIPVKENVMFLTFDDWGGDKHVTKILDTLDKYGVKASFFLIGEGVINNPNLARAISEAGHDVGNHTYTHSIINTLAADELQEDVVKCQQVVAEAIGRAPEPYFRPPTLTYDTPTTNAVLACGMEYSFLSNISTQDYERSAEEVIQYAIENAGRGELVVLHLTDNSSSDKALPTIIEKLTARGYKLDKLSNYLPKPE